MSGKNRRQYVDPSLYQPGSAAPPREAVILKEAPMPTMTPPKKPAPDAMAPHRAGVLRFNDKGEAINPRTMPPPAPPEQTPDELVTVQAGRATLVFNDEPVGEEPSAATEETEEFTEEERQKLAEYGKDPLGLQRALIHAQRKIGEQGSTIGALNKQIEDVVTTASTTKTVPAVPEPSSDMVALQKELEKEMDLYHQNVMDEKGKVHLKNIQELNRKILRAEQASERQAGDDKAMLQATQAIVDEYPGLFSPDKRKKSAEAVYVDTLASSMPGGLTLGNLKKALDEYAQEKGWTKPSKSATPNAQVDAMREQTTQTAPVTMPSNKGKKVWRKSELAQLQIDHPQKYRDLQPEIRLAYLEGRVR